MMDCTVHCSSPASPLEYQSQPGPNSNGENCLKEKQNCIRIVNMEPELKLKPGSAEFSAVQKLWKQYVFRK